MSNEEKIRNPKLELNDRELLDKRKKILEQLLKSEQQNKD